MMPQFKGKVFVLEDYNIAVARHLISGVDVWLNNPRRPMEASGTSGQKAAVNGVINFSILDGWWAEGYNQKNGWAIGKSTNYESYEVQDMEDSQSIYNILENKIIPAYYNIGKNGLSEEWLTLMKNSIISTGGKFSTSRMLVDYTDKLYMPLCNLSKKYYNSLEEVASFNEWKENLYLNWNKIEISQQENIEELSIDAGSKMTVSCTVKLPNINVEDIEVETYLGKILDNGTIEKIGIIPMKLESSKEEERIYNFITEIEFKDGGNYGYTYRVMPKNKMILDAENLNLIKWITK